MTEIQLGGRVYCSNAVLGGRFCLRSCIVNYRTEAEDMEVLLEIAAEIGASLDAEMRPPELRLGEVTSWALLGSGEFQPWSAVADRWLLERSTGDGTGA